MNIYEFENLKIGDFVRLTENELFVVKDDYVWGPTNKVCLVEEHIRTGKQCQISNDNYKYWKVVG